ncbi:MAG: hypothetical protein KGH66_03925 [Candidatus Micrarchaeota archaeon]|nr:hypothetical protein [Candidatus Micrarchaeota archaeon]
MAKGGEKNAGASALVVIGALLYLYVAVSALGGLTSGTNQFWTTAAVVLWAIGLLASLGLFFGSLGSFAWGWMEMGINMAMKGSQVAGVVLLAVSAATAGGAWSTWIIAVVIGFVLQWLGIAMAWGKAMK